MTACDVKNTLRTAAFAALLIAGVRPAAGAFDRTAFDTDLEAVAGQPHRLAGREDGSRAASRYVEQRLRQIGLDGVFVQEFPVIQPDMTECRLVVDGQSHTIHAIRPNLLQASVTPAEGLQGRSLYVRLGEPETYGTTLPTNRIVIVDFDSAMNWKYAFAFGARAVVFVGSANPSETVWQHVNIPANLPRFYVTEEQADALELRTREQEITLYAACRWQALKGRNVIGLLRGTQSLAGSPVPTETLLLAAPLDTYGEIPELAMGARDAINCAALLHCAAEMRLNPPERDVLFCFFDGQTLGHMGARAFYGAVCRELRGTKLTSTSLDERAKMLLAEREQIALMRPVLQQADLFSNEARGLAAHRFTVRMLGDHARGLSGDALETLRTLRLEKAAVLRLEAGQETPQTESQRTAIEASITQWQRNDLGWNTLQRDLDKGAITPESHERLERLTAMLLLWCDDREAELADSSAACDVALSLYNTLGSAQHTLSLHVALDLGDSGSAWTFIHGDDSLSVGTTDVDGIYTGLFKAMRTCHAELGMRVPNFNVLAVSQIFGNRAFAPALRVDSSGVARMFGILNVAVATVMDPLARQGQPCDTLEAITRDNVYTQVEELVPFLAQLADSPDLSRTSPLRPDVLYVETSWQGDKAVGPTIVGGASAAAMRPPPLRGALLAIQQPPHDIAGNTDPARPAGVPPGFDGAIRVRSNAHGMFELPPIPSNIEWEMYAVTFDTTHGPSAPAAAPASGIPQARGLISGITCQSSFLRRGDLSKTTVSVCPVRDVSLVGYGYDNRGTATQVMRGLSSVGFPMDAHLLCERGSVMALFIPPDTSRVKLFSGTGPIALENTPDRDSYQGTGMRVDDADAHMVTPLHTARDLITLNTYRLNLLRDNRIRQDSLERLHGKAKDLEIAAVDATNVSVAERLGSLQAAAEYSRRVYRPLVGVLNDLVTAAVWLLLLSIPFAFAVERLLVGAPHVYRQIGWFSLFFVLTFATLYSVNPAFRLAATPMIIFLAFAIVMLSSLVIVIMIRKLQTEVQRMQGLSVSAHRADISRLTTLGAAIQMGISTMRRRPVKTFLSTLTVILLTFTILTFSSFGNYWGVRKDYTGPQRDLPPRILLRHQLWNPLAKDVCHMLKGYLADEAIITPRYWVAPTVWSLPRVLDVDPGGHMLIMAKKGKQPVPISAAIGLALEDVQQQDRLRGLFEANAQMDRVATDGIFLTDAVAGSLGLTDADIGSAQVFLGGLPLVYAGQVRDQMAEHRLSDGSSMLPVDYAMTGGGSLEEFRKQQNRGAAAGTASIAQFVPFALDDVAIIPVATAVRLGGQIRALTVYPRDPAGVEAIAKRLATVSGLSAYGSSGGGVDRYIFTALVSTNGWRDLMLPILLGSLIIFATMMGSIADREREIYTFSALGLAPPHVASLFFAEASVYAVVGGMGGYLLGQGVVRLLGWIGQHFLIAVPTLNYSSMNVIITLLIVMATILISTLYPALKASRSANPGVQRAWRIPDAVGDRHDVLFPFTVSAYDFTGVVQFLKEHFDTHGDTSLGTFAASDTCIFRQQGKRMVGIHTRLALAPFDLGIEQSMMLFSRPSDIEGVDEVCLVFQRLAGAPRDWKRSNRVFIHELRKQFLLWRSISGEVTERYRRQTIETWYELPIEVPDAAGTAADGNAIGFEARSTAR